DRAGDVIQCEFNIVHDCRADPLSRSFDGTRQDADRELHLVHRRSSGLQLKQRRLEQRQFLRHFGFTRLASPLRMSSGIGNTIVVFFSTPISVSVWRYRSWFVTGSVAMLFSAWAWRWHRANCPSDGSLFAPSPG